jgi:hypothetical protein
VASAESQPWLRPIGGRVIGSSDVQQRKQVAAIQEDDDGRERTINNKSRKCVIVRATDCLGVVDGLLSLVEMRGSAARLSLPKHHYPADRAGAIIAWCFRVMLRGRHGTIRVCTSTGHRHRVARQSSLIFMATCMSIFDSLCRYDTAHVLTMSNKRRPVLMCCRPS